MLCNGVKRKGRDKASRTEQILQSQHVLRRKKNPSSPLPNLPEEHKGKSLNSIAFSVSVLSSLRGTGGKRSLSLCYLPQSQRSERYRLTGLSYQLVHNIVNNIVNGSCTVHYSPVVLLHPIMMITVTAAAPYKSVYVVDASTICSTLPIFPPETRIDLIIPVQDSQSKSLASNSETWLLKSLRPGTRFLYKWRIPMW